jgi:putative hydrolase of the HAD superfamily
VKFRAVFFDAGETLVHPSPSFPELFAGILLGQGHVRDPGDVVNASRVVLHRFSEAAREQELWTTSPDRSRTFWTGVYERMLVELGLPSADGLAGLIYAAFTDLDNYALFDDVRPTIDVLREQDLTLGIVSNFEIWLEDLLERLDIRDAFPVRVISGHVGVEKPDLRIYRMALERAGVEPHDAAFVGDNPEFDIDPAAALGMTPVLIDRRGRHPDHGGIRLEDLRDLVAALEAA